MSQVVDWAFLEKAVQRPLTAAPKPTRENSDRRKIALIAEELMRREGWSRRQARRYLVELAEAFTEEEKP